MEKYYNFALLIVGFAIFVGTWIYIQNFFEKRNNRKNVVQKPLNNERIVRSQNTLLVFYGIKVALNSENYTEHENCSTGSDPRCISAKSAGLNTISDRLTDSEDYFLYIGESLGKFGLEHSDYGHLGKDELQKIISDVDAKLKPLNYPEKPALHFQSIYEY